MTHKTASFFVVFLIPLFLLSGCFLDRYSYYSSVGGAPGNISAIAVQRGDNLYMVAKRYDVTLRDLIDVNNLQPPYKIYPGQGLRLPKKRFHIVRRFETVNSIARKRNVDVHGLVKMNNLQPPYTIHENQKLNLPYPQGAAPKWKKRQVTPQKKPLKIEPLLPVAPLLLRVKKEKKIAPLLPVAPLLPRIKKEKKIAPLLPLKEKSILKSAPDFVVDLPPRKPHRFLVKKAASKKRHLKKKIKKETKRKAISKFSWPLRGRILAKYGKKTGGLKNDGVNIAAKKGTTIKAAEHGHVVYVGSALKGYGKLILIRHRGGWITTYAHCDRTFVNKGDLVKTGGKIATVGSSGNVKKPQLHFEVRKKTRTVDPLRYLR